MSEDVANPLLEGLQLRRRPEACAVVIFGASGDLTKRKLIPALYALAFHQLGARSVGVSVLTPALELDRPQLTLDDLKAQEPIWRGLRHMQESGVFGMRGRLRDEFAFHGDYPLATLAIDEDVLAEKWGRTHRELSDGEDEV